jgi:hypothetical protein
MSDGSNAGERRTAFSLKGAEICVALLFLAVVVPTAVYVGVIGWVAGEMLVTDPPLEG